jgi:hypothetical protein
MYCTFCTLCGSVANRTIYHSIYCEQKSVIKHAVRQLGPVPRGIRAAMDSGLAPGARQSGTASKNRQNARQPGLLLSS